METYFVEETTQYQTCTYSHSVIEGVTSDEEFEDLAAIFFRRKLKAAWKREKKAKKDIKRLEESYLHKEAIARNKKHKGSKKSTAGNQPTIVERWKPKFLRKGEEK